MKYVALYLLLATACDDSPVHSCDRPPEQIETTEIELAAFPDPLFPSGHYTLAGLDIPGAEYIALRFETFEGPFAGTIQTYLWHGTPSTAATTELESARSDDGWSGTHGRHCTDYGLVLVVTAGDRVTLAGNNRELMALLGRIDNADKAAVFATLNAGLADDDTTRIRRLADGSYEIVYEVQIACGPGRAYHEVLQVSPTGSLRIVARGLEYGEPIEPCPG